MARPPSSSFLKSLPNVFDRIIAIGAAQRRPLVQAQPQHEKRVLRPSTMERQSFAAAMTTANANEKAYKTALKSIPDKKVRKPCGNMR
jgi:hypothetical protein